MSPIVPPTSVMMKSKALVQPLPQHPPLDLVRDVGHHLNGLAQIVAMALAVYDRLIDASCRNTVVAGGADARKPLVVPQVEVGLETVLRHVALAVLVGVQRAWVYVDVGVELLDGDFVASCLQQLTYAGRNDALSQRGNDTACDENILGVHKTNLFYGLQSYDILSS